MNKASAYIQLLFEEISDDLRRHVDGDKLQDEVQKEVEKQILSGLVQAVGEYSNHLSWNHDKTKGAALRSKIERNIGYVTELFQVNNDITGVLGAGSPIGEAPEIDA